MHTEGAPPSRLLIVSNRLPVSVRWRSGDPQLVRSSGGLATGLERLERDGERLWIGWPGPLARATRAQVTDIERRLTARGLAAVHLSPEEVEGYYDGFSNGVVWPLFHYLLDRMPIDSGDWTHYRQVNQHFADAVAAAWRPGDRVWVHDYHLMLVPALLRARIPDARIGFFLHIPFPAADVFRTLPWRRPVVEGLLGADVIGMHTASYARHFMTTIRELLGAETRADGLRWQGRDVTVAAFPMGVDDRHFGSLADRPDVQASIENIRAEARGRRILLGVDRLDYTKGIPRRLIAFQRLLERQPALREQVRFIQVAVPSRVDVREYKTFRKGLDELIGRINGAYGTINSVPIHYLFRSISPRELVALYRAADVMVVTPLRDGMNLVAKEFVASRTDDDGVLVLSEFAGAADQLPDALIVNPYDTDGVADAMARALTLPREERGRRMRAMRERVSQSSVRQWAARFVDELDGPPAARESAPPRDALSALVEGRLPTSGRTALLVDYDGTLVPFAPTPDEAVPDRELLDLLVALGANPRIDLHIVSGRSVDTVNRWFWQVPGALWAEHGAACRPSRGAGWEPLTPPGLDAGWMDRAEAELDALAAVTPGALVERKQTGVAWHYRMVEPALAAERLARVRECAAALAGSAEVEIIEGHKVLEIRPRGVSKANVARRIARALPEGTAMIAIGDDRTDEEMFAALRQPATAIRVGDGATRAGFRLANPPAVRLFLATLLDQLGGRRVPQPVRAVRHVTVRN